MLENINLNMIETVLGPPLKKVGDEYIWQCPYCKDKGKDNILYNHKKNVIFCFADENHSKLLLKRIWSSLKEQGNVLPPISRTKKTQTQEVVKNSSLPLIQIQKFKTNVITYNQELLKNKSMLEVIYGKRGITKDTITDCNIGLDMKNERFTFPSVKFGSANEVIGFEYRPLDLSKNGLYREKGTPTGLVQINSISSDTVNLVVLEGYLDSYLFYQHLKSLDQEHFYHIVTPSNGVTSILRHFNSLSDKLGQYKNVYLYLDSDTAGEKAMLELKQKYPQVKPFTMTCGCKDFNEHYLKCIKAQIP